MRRFFCASLLALALVVPAAVANDSGTAKGQKDGGQTTEKATKQKGKQGTDCDPKRAGVRCSRPKPRKPWFFGKA
jgi:hypothetical protein